MSTYVDTGSEEVKISCRSGCHSQLMSIEHPITHTAVCDDSNTVRVSFLLTADSALMLILRILIQEVRIKWKRHTLFFCIHPWRFLSDGENGAYITNNNTRIYVWDLGNQWTSMRMFWKRRKPPGTWDGPETVKGAVHLRHPSVTFIHLALK